MSFTVSLRNQTERRDGQETCSDGALYVLFCNMIVVWEVATRGKRELKTRDIMEESVTACLMTWTMLGQVAMDGLLIQQIFLSFQDLCCASFKIISIALTSSTEVISQKLLTNGIE